MLYVTLHETLCCVSGEYMLPVYTLQEPLRYKGHYVTRATMRA